MFSLESEDFQFISWWFREAKVILSLANPTDDLWEKVLVAPFIECIYSAVSRCAAHVARLLSVLKTSVRLSFQGNYL